MYCSPGPARPRHTGPLCGPRPPPAPGSRAPRLQGLAPPARRPGSQAGTIYNLSLLEHAAPSQWPRATSGVRTPCVPGPPPQAPVLWAPSSSGPFTAQTPGARGRPASSGRRRGKAEPRDTPRSGVAQAEEGETPRRHSRGRRTEAVSAGTRGRGQRRGPGKRTVEDTDHVPWSRVRPKRLRDAINPRRPDTVSSEKLRPPQP